MVSIISSTVIIPEASESIVGLNNPQRDPINVISLTTVGVKSRFALDAIVDFKITIPRGHINFSIRKAGITTCSLHYQIIS